MLTKPWILRKPTSKEAVLNRVKVADRESPIIVFQKDGELYDGFADTIKSRQMIKDLPNADYSLFGIFHKDSNLEALNDSNS